MNQKELKELIDYLIEKDIAEFELERGDVKVRIKRAADPPPVQEARYFAAPPVAPVVEVAAPPTAATTAAAKEAATAAAKVGLHVVHSPIVGTFYESPSPGSPPFVKAGDTVEVGQVICIVEAMKLMNEIEADVSGEVVERLVANGQPIEYGQDLFTIRPKA
jgi:acetyl-CoA carboxylase biotin carboxyl carrier protein